MVLGAGWVVRDKQVRPQQVERGASLFHGERPLIARLQGHQQALPSTAVRCANCHEAPNVAPADLSTASSGAKVPARPFASALTGDALVARRSRHGGPPSAYDSESMCALLRTGVDPAQVMIPNTMPRYEMTPADCADLWAYLRHEPV